MLPYVSTDLIRLERKWNMECVFALYTYSNRASGNEVRGYLCVWDWDLFV